MDVDDARQLFPGALSQRYFATNGYGLLSAPARDAIVAAAEGLAVRGYGANHRLEKVIDVARGKVASLVGAQPHEIGFTRNTADGLIYAAESFPWRSGDEVLAFAREYPTVVYPFASLERHGVTVRIEQAENDCVTAEQVKALLRPETRAVALSWVRFDNGARADLDAIGAVLHDAGVLFVVDAIQGLGVLPVDVTRAHIGFLAAGTHKWLCGLAGLGVLYIDEGLIDSLLPVRAGLGSMVARDLGPEKTGYPFALRPDASRVEEGASNNVAITALDASLGLLGDVGTDAIATQVKAVTDRVCDGFVEAGGRVRSPRDNDSWSGIMLLEPPDGLPIDDLWGRLLEVGAILGVRDGALWCAAHFYNSLEDADALLAALPS
jgi:selenocysteine lyase/cysteine desulfurase